jgi:large subunit ribosomal protein L4
MTTKKIQKTVAPSAATSQFADEILQQIKDSGALPKTKLNKEFSVWVRVLLQNWRQGTVACKDRGEVTSRSNKKPWKQKGTGRARAGSARSPIWRGGGVSFGPQERSRVLSMQSTKKKQVLLGMLTNMLTNNNIVVADWQLEGDRPKTSSAVTSLKNAGLYASRVVLLLSAYDQMAYASFVNIANVDIVFFDQVNAYNLARGNKVVVLNKDLNQFKEMVSKWS